MSKRELFLQNRLAMASVLLYECTRELKRSHSLRAEGLLIECETYFNETRKQIQQEMTNEVGAATPAAPRAEGPSSPPAEQWKPSEKALLGQKLKGLLNQGKP